MRSPRSISLPLSFVITCAVWFAFLWTMQHAPTSRRAGSGEDVGGARSSGGLANNFATAVVKFFDDQDPRELEEGASPVEPLFDSEMVEYLPLPKMGRKELAKDLPEVFANLSLTPRNLFRSDVDLDGDRDLDLALLVRLSKTEALGAVLEYVGDEKFRFAGKFTCRYERAEDFPRCFQIVLTRAGTMHIFSRSLDLEAEEGPSNGTPEGLAARGSGETGKRAGWRWMRLEEGALARYGSYPDPLCDGPQGPPGEDRGHRNTGREPAGLDAAVEAQVEPVAQTTEDLVRFVAPCGAKPICRVYRFDAGQRAATLVEQPDELLCKD